MSDLKNIVVIGASSAGHNLVNELAPNLPGTHRILLIDALGFSFWPIAALRAAVVPGWEKRVTAPLTKESIFPAGSQHEVIAPNKVVELRESSVVLEHPFEGSTEIPFVKAVIATGAQQPAPMRPEPDSTEEEYMALLVKYQNEVKQAKKVVIIGGGSVGLEVAGDIKQRYPETDVTIVHSLPHVLNPSSKPADASSGRFSYSNPPTPLKLSTNVESQLKELKVNLVLDDRVEIPEEGSASASEWDGSSGLQSAVKTLKLKSGKSLEADYVFVSIGNKPNVSLVEKVDSGAIASGLIAVDEYLKVISKTADSPLTKNYYSFGDCSTAPGWKTAQGAQLESVGAAANLLAEIRGKPIKPFVRPKPAAMFIPLGNVKGSGILDFPIVGNVSVPTFAVKVGKGNKLLCEDAYYPRFKGPLKPKAAPIPA